MITDPATSALQTFNKVIDAVLKEPVGPKRWRAAHDLLWLNVSSKNRQQYNEVIRENAVARDLVNDFGHALSSEKAKSVTNSDNTLRQALAIPHGAYYAIQRSDPRAFSDQSNAAKMFKTFPEYTTRKVY